MLKPFQANSDNQRADDAVVVSFVVPCFNVAKYLPRCIDSIARQTGCAFEIVCVNDGSTDETAGVLSELSRKIPNLHNVSKENGGLASARNAGVRAARGTYISFVDGDDFLDPSFLQSCYSAMCELAADMCVAGLRTVRSKKEFEKYAESKPRPDFKLVPQASLGTYILTDELSCSACGKIIRRDICLANPFQPGRFHEDVEIISSLYVQSDAIAWTTACLYGYYMRRGSITHVARPSGKQLSDFILAYGSLEEAISSGIGCSESSLLQHKMVAACRFHSMRIRSSFASDFRADENELLAQVERHATTDALTGVPRGVKARFALLKRAAILYDLLFWGYERLVKRV